MTHDRFLSPDTVGRPIFVDRVSWAIGYTRLRNRMTLTCVSMTSVWR